MKIFAENHPVISALIKKNTVQEYISEAQRAAAQGADMIAIDLGSLKPEFRNEACLRQIFSSVKLPFYVFFYRGDQWLPEFNRDDAARQPFLLTAADAGAAMIDVMGDLYDAADREITYDAEAVAKQKELISEIHKRGAQAIISSHTPDFLTADEVLAHLRSLASRGADVVKLVTGINSPGELAEALRAVLLLKEQLNIPFCYLCNGSYGRRFRFLCPALGNCLSFASVDISPSAETLQPNIAELKSVTGTIIKNIC